MLRNCFLPGLLLILLYATGLSQNTEVDSSDYDKVLTLDTVIRLPERPADTIPFMQEGGVDTSEYIPNDPGYNLLIASYRGYAGEVMRLLNSGADVNAATSEGITPLMYAVEGGYLDVVEVLVEHHADIDKRPNNGITALISAVQNNYIDIAEYLIRHGADIDKADNDDITPLMVAIASANFVIADLLLYYGADFTLRDQSGTDALILSSFMGFLDISGELIGNGADVNSADNEGFTPLHVAVQNGFIEMVELLLDSGANINARNIYNYTPLAIAVVYNDKEMTEFLISRGATVNSRINCSQTPYDLARKNKNDSMTMLLRQKGAHMTIWPTFSQVSMGPDALWNADDFLTGLSLGLADSKYNLDLYAGYWFRPFATRVLEQENTAVYYQFRERRAAFSIGADKKFLLIRTGISDKWGILAGVRESFTYGSYRGTADKPGGKFLVVPRAGLYWQNSGIAARVTYERMNLDLYSFQKGWICFSFLMLFNRRSAGYHPKYISWFNLS